MYKSLLFYLQFLCWELLLLLVSQWYLRVLFFRPIRNVSNIADSMLGEINILAHAVPLTISVTSTQTMFHSAHAVFPSHHKEQLRIWIKRRLRIHVPNNIRHRMICIPLQQVSSQLRTGKQKIMTSLRYLLKYTIQSRNSFDVLCLAAIADTCKKGRWRNQSQARA
jgi:hypothetical protein